MNNKARRAPESGNNMARRIKFKKITLYVVGEGTSLRRCLGLICLSGQMTADTESTSLPANWSYKKHATGLKRHGQEICMCRDYNQGWSMLVERDAPHFF